jgi:hypothetical protein
MNAPMFAGNPMCSNAEIQINPEEDKEWVHYCLINSRERSLVAIQNSTHSRV